MSYLKIAFALLLVGVGGFSVWSYRHMAQQAATADQRIEAAEEKAHLAAIAAATVAERMDRLSEEVVSRAEIDRAIRAARVDTSRNLDTASREDPTAADYLGQPIPQRVRDAYTAPPAAPQR